MKRFFEWWGRRVQHIFTGQRRKESFIQRVVTGNCVFWWRAWMFFIWLNVWVWLVQTPWPVVGRRIIVRGQENLKNASSKRYRAENLLCLPNHGSHLSPILAMLGFMPRAVFNPKKYFPWQTPNAKIMSDSILPIAHLGPLVVIGSDENGVPNDGMALRAIMKQGKEHSFISFIEGTQSYHSFEPRIQTASGVTVGYPRGGIGLVVYYNRPAVIPVLIRGEQQIYPPETSILKLLKNLLFSDHKLEVIYGAPMDISWIPAENKKSSRRERRRELLTEIGERVRDAIVALDNDAHAA